MINISIHLLVSSRLFIDRIRTWDFFKSSLVPSSLSRVLTRDSLCSPNSLITSWPMASLSLETISARRTLWLVLSKILIPRFNVSFGENSFQAIGRLLLALLLNVFHCPDTCVQLPNISDLNWIGVDSTSRFIIWRMPSPSEQSLLRVTSSERQTKQFL